MTLSLDHVILAVTDLDAALHSMASLGFMALPGGEHASGTTRNALVVFQDGTYIELLALTGRAPLPGNTAMDFSSLLASGEGWVGYALLSNDLAADAAAMRSRGIPVDTVQSGSRQRPDGTVLRWQLATIGGGFSPFLLQDETPRQLRIPNSADATHHENGVTGIRRVTIAASDLERAVTYYEALLDMSAYHGIGEANFPLGGATLTVTQSRDDNALEYTLSRVTFNSALPISPLSVHGAWFEFAP